MQKEKHSPGNVTEPHITNKQEAVKDPANVDTAPAQCLNSAQPYFFLVTKYPLNDIGFELALPTFITLSRETFNFPF